ncbi:hypothetical protein JCM3775_000345 [Rhodotorula graminis]
MSDSPVCTDPTCQYGYRPSISLGVVFLVLFALTGLAHLGQVLYARRYWWMMFMVVGCLLEILGWAARLWAHWEPLSFDAYVMQICCLIIGPTFFSAALYWAGGIIIEHVARDKSWLSGKWFKTAFLTADVVSLVVQAVGGGMAGSAVGTNNEQQSENGSNIMLAGIVIQLAVMVFYVVYMAVWYCRARSAVTQQGTRLQLMLLAMFAASVAIIVRGCYRTPELEEGFSGWIAQQQIWQLFDAIPIVFASVVLNVIHPHWFLVFTNDSRYASSRNSDATMVPMTGLSGDKFASERTSV